MVTKIQTYEKKLKEIQDNCRIFFYYDFDLPEGRNSTEFFKPHGKTVKIKKYMEYITEDSSTELAAETID